MRSLPSSNTSQRMGLFIIVLVAVIWAGSANAHSETVVLDYTWSDGYRYDHASFLEFETPPVSAEHDGALGWEHSFPLLLNHVDTEVVQAKLVITAEVERAGVAFHATLNGQAVRWTPSTHGVVETTLMLPLPKENPALWSGEVLAVLLPASANGILVKDAKLLVQFEERVTPVPDPATTKLRAELVRPGSAHTGR